MTVHLVGVRAPAHLRLKRIVEFDSVSERDVVGHTTNDAQICCQVGGISRSVAECRACPRFLAWCDDSSLPRVRCRWTHRDLVRDCMTRAGALTVTRPDATCAEAERQAQGGDAQEILVSEGRFLVGVASLCELRDGGTTPVRERMNAEPFAIQAAATLGEATAAMALLGIRALPVVSRDFVVGMLTRRDLARLGVPAELFGGARSLTLTLAEAHLLLRGER
jgi:CBS domain-containing protein